MSKKVFRPFWSYDVQQTEQWLSIMAEKGYHLKEIKRRTSQFVFDLGERQTINYRLVYDKMPVHSLPKAIEEDGWKKVIHTGYWSVLVNDKKIENIQTSPVREGIIKRNRTHFFIYSGVGIYLSMSVLFQLTIFFITFVIADDVSITVVESPYWVLTPFIFLFGLALWIHVFYSIFKLRKTNAKLINPDGDQNQVFLDTMQWSKETEKQLKKAGQIIVKRKFNWMYSPDKLEQWLEMMEEQGYNLYRVNRMGNAFFFIKGNPRKISYCVDYQNVSKEGYISIHRDAGWKDVFTSMSSLQKWTIWAREYTSEEERPQLYSDKSHLLQHARRITITYSCLYLPLVIIYVSLIRSIVQDALDNGIHRLTVTNISLFSICILLFGSYIIRIWMYYLRLRKV